VLRLYRDFIFHVSVACPQSLSKKLGLKPRFLIEAQPGRGLFRGRKAKVGMGRQMSEPNDGK
jgi:hypothetical protein